jgi:hypothetical protein
MKFSLKHDWPLLAIGGGGALALFIANANSGSSSASGKGNGPTTLWPKVVGGQRGTAARSSSVSTSNDSGSLAAQVIGDVIGQRTALAQGQDQIKMAEDEIAGEEEITNRNDNTEAQLSLNSETPPPNGWNQFFGELFGALPSFFGIPSLGGSSEGLGSFLGGGGSGSMLSGEPWDGYYPGMSYPTPTGGMFA